MALLDSTAMIFFIVGIIIAIIVLALIPSRDPNTGKPMSLLERIIISVGGAISTVAFVAIGIAKGISKEAIKQFLYLLMVLFLVLTVVSFWYGASQLAEEEDFQLSVTFAMRSLGIGYDYFFGFIPGR